MGENNRILDDLKFLLIKCECHSNYNIPVDMIRKDLEKIIIKYENVFRDIVKQDTNEGKGPSETNNDL